MQQRIGSTQFCLVTLSTWAFSKNNQTSEIDDVEIKGIIVDFFCQSSSGIGRCFYKFLELEEKIAEFTWFGDFCHDL